MVYYILRRLLSSIPVIIGIMVVTFVLARLIPGEPCRAMLGEKATPAVCERFTREHGLDKPIYVQLAIYMDNMLQGDFGSSIRFSRPVTTILIERLPTTMELGLSALLIATLIGIPAGIIAAVRHNSPVDVITMVGANIGVSMPVYWLGLMLAYLFAIKLQGTPFWLPPSSRLDAGVVSIPFCQVWGWQVPPGTTLEDILQFISNFYVFNSLITGDWAVLGSAIKHLILPSLALSTIPMAIIARMTRSSMLEVLKQDYIRTARAKGLRRQLVILRHAFRNAGAHCDHHRPAGGHALRRGGAHRDHLRLCRGRPHPLRSHHRPRLPHYPGLHRGHRHWLRIHQPAGRHLVHLHRPAHPTGVSHGHHL